MKPHSEDLVARRSKRLMTLGLGALWALDGVLQLQPQMFGRALAFGVVANSIMSLPSPLYYASLKFVSGFFLRNVGVLNAGFAALQLALGACLLAGPAPAKRVALAVSVAWGLLVWVFGEGMGGVLGPTMTGGVFPGTPSLLSGFPGAALVYALIAAFLLLPEDHWRFSGGLSIVRDAPAMIFLLSAAVQAAPLMWTAYGQASIFAANPGKLPAGLSAELLLPLARFTAARSVLSNGLELAACALAAYGTLTLQRWGYLFALGLLAFAWVFPLAMAGLLAGTATDPNTPPAIALLMVPAVVAVREAAAA